MGFDIRKLYDASKVSINSDVSKIEEDLEYEEILLTISKEIFSYRKEKNLTQKDVAKKLKVNQVMISKLESGEFNPTFRYIYKISKGLTNSSELFLKILKSIMLKLENVSEGIYNFNKSKAKYSKIKNSKIIYVNFDTSNIENNNSIGGYYYGKECTSSVSNA